jgi:hypothetical protein
MRWSEVEEDTRTAAVLRRSRPYTTDLILYDKVYSLDLLVMGWGQIRRNWGASGIDGTTIAVIVDWSIQCRLIPSVSRWLLDIQYSVDHWL